MAVVEIRGETREARREERDERRKKKEERREKGEGGRTEKKEEEERREKEEEHRRTNAHNRKNEGTELMRVPVCEMLLHYFGLTKSYAQRRCSSTQRTLFYSGCLPLLQGIN